MHPKRRSVYPRAFRAKSRLKYRDEDVDWIEVFRAKHSDGAAPRSLVSRWASLATSEPSGPKRWAVLARAVSETAVMGRAKVETVV